jgi:hypothetical protein
MLLSFLEKFTAKINFIGRDFSGLSFFIFDEPVTPARKINSTQIKEATIPTNHLPRPEDVV